MSTVSQQIKATSLNRALLVLGDWWTVLLIREAFLGAQQFDDFQFRLGIPRQTLSNRLRDLVRHGLFYTRPYQERPVRHAYRLTEKGFELYPYALLLWRWQHKWGQRGATGLPRTLTHLGCGHAIEPRFVCAHCREEVTIRDVERRDGPGAAVVDPVMPRIKRQTTSRHVLDDKELYAHGAFVAADRWTHLILASAYLGCTTFDAFQKEIGIAPSILSQRLRLLSDSLLFSKSPDPSDSRRFHYRLTDRSRDLFPISLALIRWADRWMPHPDGPPMLRFHKACGAPLQPVVACNACGDELKPWQVRFE